MPRYFGRFPAGGRNCTETQGEPVMTADEAYTDGYECGMTWDKFYPHNKYVPGGPYRCYYKERFGRTPKDQADWKAYCEATQENNERWRKGFDDARFALSLAVAHGYKSRIISIHTGEVVNHE